MYKTKLVEGSFAKNKSIDIEVNKFLSENQSKIARLIDIKLTHTLNNDYDYYTALIIYVGERDAK